MYINEAYSPLENIFAMGKATQQQAVQAQAETPERGRDRVTFSEEARQLAAQMQQHAEERRQAARQEAGVEGTGNLLSAPGSEEQEQTSASNQLRTRFTDLISQQHKEETTEEKIERIKRQLAEAALKKEKTKTDQERIKSLQNSLADLEKQLEEEKQDAAKEAGSGKASTAAMANAAAKSPAAGAAGMGARR